MKLQRVPAILLLAMFSIASRYTSVSSGEVPPPEAGSMWAAGDKYLESAKKILDSTYAHSRPGTCQALLLMGYREVGIGAMAQAWLYVGMAVRMAQDLGLHKNADKWVNVGKTLFTPEELQERRRIWYGCVVMDKYVSSYIGMYALQRRKTSSHGVAELTCPPQAAPSLSLKTTLTRSYHKSIRSVLLLIHSTSRSVSD